MPTNKLWLEHTEKAAWESVQALREKLAEAEKRMQRLAPPIDGWQPLLDALDSAKQELSLQGRSYAELIGELSARARDDAARLRAVEREFTELKNQALRDDVVPLPSSPTLTRAADDEDDWPSSERAREGEHEVVRAIMSRKHALSAEGLSTDVDALLARIEAKIEEMNDLDDAAIHEAAVDLGALALLLALASKSGVD